MKFHVAGLLQDPVGATRHHEVNEPVGRIDEQVNTAGPVTGDVKLTRTNQGVLVAARLHVTVLLDCSRCLTEAAVPLDVRFSEQFVPVVDIATGLPLPAQEDQSVFTIDETHELDLTEAIRQYTILALPLAPLCSAACPGLCPSCGRNLNEGPCGCDIETGDERLRALAQLLEPAAGEPTKHESTTKGRGKKRRSQG